MELNKDTKLVLLKKWSTPYQFFVTGEYAPVRYWASKLNKNTDEFIQDFNSGSLDLWFKVEQ